MYPAVLKKIESLNLVILVWRLFDDHLGDSETFGCEKDESRYKMYPGSACLCPLNKPIDQCSTLLTTGSMDRRVCLHSYFHSTLQ